MCWNNTAIQETKMMSINSNSIPRVALVTGAAGSIGRAVVRRLGSEGWKVAGIDLNKADVDLFLAAGCDRSGGNERSCCPDRR